MRDRVALIVPMLGFALVGAFLFWFFVCRGESEELRRQIDSALYADSVARAEIDSLRAANDSLATSVATMRAQLGAALDDVDSLVARPPRVIRVMVPPDTGTGPAVPVDVVLATVYDGLRRSCSAASVLCRQTTDSLALLAERRTREAQRATARADTLALRVAAFTVPRSPSRWSLGAGAGYGVVASNGQACTGPGAFAGVNFRLF